MDFNNTCSVYEKTPLDYTYIIALYSTIAIIAKYYQTYFKDMNFEYNSDDEYNGVICI